MLWSVGTCHGKCVAYQLLRCMRCAISLVILYIYSQFKVFNKAIGFLQIKKIIESNSFLFMRKCNTLWLSMYLVYFWDVINCIKASQNGICLSLSMYQCIQK